MLVRSAFPKMRTVRLVAVLALCSVSLLSGCGFFTKTNAGSFFPDPGSGDTGGGTGTAATNYLFVANAGANSVTGLGISSTGTLASLSGSPINFSAAPTALVVSKDNKFLWVGTSSQVDAPGQIFGFSIAADGTLAALNNGNAIANASCADMQVSPDGKWLMVLDNGINAIDLFGINSDGTLTQGLINVFNLNVQGTVLPKQLRISPTGTFAIAAVGSAGALYFSFDTTTGNLTYVSQALPPDVTSDNGIAIDSTGSYLYEARSGNAAGLVVSTISSSGMITPTTANVYTTGSNPYSVVLDNTGKYVYVANRGDSTVSGWSIGAGAALTPINGSPFSSGVGVTSLGADSTGSYIAAAASSGSPDVTLYGFDNTNAGRLYTVSSSATGTNASVVALSH